MNYTVRLSLRDPQNKQKYLGDEATWEKSQEILEQILIDHHIEYVKAEGEAAFYGPKMDIMTKDSLGREWQISTIQVDFNMPRRFKLEYTDADGSAKTPVMIHRALIGSPERFMGILIEHFAGAFPVWLAPEQVRIIPVADAFLPYAQTLAARFADYQLRAKIDEGNESFGKKIRNGELQKIPYLLIVGEKEEKTDTVSVRSYKTKEQYTISAADFVQQVKQMRDERSL